MVIEKQRLFICIILKGNLRFIVINVFTLCTCIDCEVHWHQQIISSSIQQDWFSNHITQHDKGLKTWFCLLPGRLYFILSYLSIFLSLFHLFSNYQDIINFCKIYIQIEITLYWSWMGKMTKIFLWHFFTAILFQITITTNNVTTLWLYLEQCLYVMTFFFFFQSAISDECFTIRFVDVDEVEVVAAVRGISLR